jgi:hypothetical protein
MMHSGTVIAVDGTASRKSPVRRNLIALAITLAVHTDTTVMAI